jgi:SHS2 domain-containing protein
MMKHVMIAGLCLCIASSCTPKKPEVTLVATSKEEYEKSLILMATGLSAKDRLILSKAIAIIQKDTPGLDQVDDDTNNRVKVSGKTRTELINEARTIVLDWYRDLSVRAKLFTMYRSITNENINLTIVKVSRHWSEYYTYYSFSGVVINKSKIPVTLLSMEYDDRSPLVLDKPVLVGPSGRATFVGSTNYSLDKSIVSKRLRRIHLSVALDDGSNKEFNYFVSPREFVDDNKIDTWARPEYIDYLNLIGVDRPVLK